MRTINYESIPAGIILQNTQKNSVFVLFVTLNEIEHKSHFLLSRHLYFCLSFCLVFEPFSGRFRVVSQTHIIVLL